MQTALTHREENALLVALESGDVTADARDAAMKGITQFVSTQSRLGFEFSDVMGAAADGFKNKGDKVLAQALSALSRYLNSWVILAIFAFAIYAMVDKSIGLGKRLWAWISSLSTAFSTVTSVGRGLSFFKDEASNADPSDSLGVVATVIAAEVPLFGVAMSLIPKGASDEYRLPSSGLHDVAYDELDEEVDAFEDEEPDSLASATYAAALKLGVRPEALNALIPQMMVYDEASDENQEFLDVAYDAFEVRG
jgi:hypothetical protein